MPHITPEMLEELKVTRKTLAGLAKASMDPEVMLAAERPAKTLERAEIFIFAFSLINDLVEVGEKTFTDEDETVAG